jgi:hypothetical protein
MHSSNNTTKNKFLLTHTYKTRHHFSLMYKVVQIWPGLFLCKQVTVCPGHILTTLYFNWNTQVCVRRQATIVFPERKPLPRPTGNSTARNSSLLIQYLRTSKQCGLRRTTHLKCSKLVYRKGGGGGILEQIEVLNTRILVPVIFLFFLSFLTKSKKFIEVP